MQRSKLSKIIFISAFIVFMIALIYASYDISQRTTFPGSKPQLKERIKQTYLETDSLKTRIQKEDSIIVVD
jgi:flagellar basal body-associated protein FliL